jgi:hypothetical protein
VKTVVTTVEAEDWSRWRIWDVQFRALELNPTAYSRQETEDIMRQRQTLWMDTARKYDLDPNREWDFDVYTGVLRYVDD